jgi:rod shape-determining protein MreB
MAGFWQQLFQGGPFYIRLSAKTLSIRDVAQKRSVEMLPLAAIDHRQSPSKVLAVGHDAKNLTLTEGQVLVNPFDHPRSILADFTVAEKLLMHGIRQLASSALLRPSPLVIIHPLEHLEGGLTPVEVRALMELATSAGARSAAVWTGPELVDTQITGHLYPGDHWLPEQPSWA